MVGTVIKLISTGERWRVQDDYSGEMLSEDLSKDEALEVARRIAKDRGGEVVMLGDDGKTRYIEEFEYGFETPATDAAPHTVAISTVSVVQDDDQKWLVEGDQPDEVLGTFSSKDDAIAFARPAAKTRKAHLIVHQPDGNIEWTEDYAWAEGER